MIHKVLLVLLCIVVAHCDPFCDNGARPNAPPVEQVESTILPG